MVILVRSRTRLVAHAFALMCAIYVLVVSVGPASYARFRGPTTPILALYAALGLTTVGNRLHRRAQQSHAAR